MRLRIVGQDDAWVEQAFGIKKRLDAAHQIGGLLAPFHLYERRHVAAGAVLGFERAVVLPDHQIADVVHKARVALHLGVIAKILGEDEVQIALQCVAEDDGLGITMLQEKRLQIEGGGGQRFNRERHVFDDHGGAGFAHGADGGERALAHFPVHLAGGTVGGKLRRLHSFNALQRGQHRVHLELQCHRGFGAHFDQQGRCICAQRLNNRGQTGLGFDRTQGRAIQ